MTEAPVTPPDVYVSFSAEINANTCESLIAVTAQQANNGVSHVCLMLSTPGGNVMNGLNVYNVLRAMPFELTTHNVGNVDSIGNAIFLAGDHRYACPHSTFMFHGVALTVQGTGAAFDEKALREHLGSLSADQARIASILVDRTRMDTGEVAESFLEARTKDATYAVGVGIVDDVRDVNILPGAPVVSLVFQR